MNKEKNSEYCYMNSEELSYLANLDDVEAIEEIEKRRKAFLNLSLQPRVRYYHNGDKGFWTIEITPKVAELLKGAGIKYPSGI